MAASVNNIAATFASSALSSSEHHHSPPTSSALSITSSSSVRPIFASWNPHSSLPLSSRSSLLSLYGLPGPLRRPLRRRPSLRLPNITLFSLDDTDTPRSISLSSLSPPGRNSVLLSVPGAFLSPRRRNPRSLSAESLVEKAGELRRRGAGAVGIVSANDVFVMRAWGEALGAAGGGVAMLSDPGAALARALGMAADFTGGPEGLGVRSEGFCLVAADDGAVKALFADGDGEFDDVIRALL